MTQNQQMCYDMKSVKWNKICSENYSFWHRLFWKCLPERAAIYRLQSYFLEQDRTLWSSSGIVWSVNETWLTVRPGNQRMNSVGIVSFLSRVFGSHYRKSLLLLFSGGEQFIKPFFFRFLSCAITQCSFLLLQHVIRGNRPIKAEMAHQLYVLQVLTFNLLEERMMTKMDPNDQVKIKIIYNNQRKTFSLCLYSH